MNFDWINKYIYMYIYMPLLEIDMFNSLWKGKLLQI